MEPEESDRHSSEDYRKTIRKMNFKPTLWKIIISLAVVVVGIILINYINSFEYCESCAPRVCEEDYYSWISIKPLCDCDCTSLKTMLSTNHIHMLIPFIIAYVIWSLFEKKRQR